MPSIGLREVPGWETKCKTGDDLRDGEAGVLEAEPGVGGVGGAEDGADGCAVGGSDWGEGVGGHFGVRICDFMGCM